MTTIGSPFMSLLTKSNKASALAGQRLKRDFGKHVPIN
jgi:hypothetical protein